ncbi:MAG: LytTR family DNA-binding domain-containing protein [Bacteroidales bacterium]
MYKKVNQFIALLTKDSRLFLGISFGIFLFVLFFQPFPIDHFDFNNKLLVTAGLPVILLILMITIRTLIPWLKNKQQLNGQSAVLPSYLNGFILLILSSVAFTFYILYVGRVEITFYIIFKIVLICLAPPVIIKVVDYNNELLHQNQSLFLEKNILQKQIEKYEEDYLNKSIVFNSENSTEELSLVIADVVFVKSADNYVEIIYKQEDSIKKKLIRQTLKNIELQLKPYSNFIRCHRMYIVNTHFIDKLNRNFSNHWLILKGHEEQIPVSRQYFLKLKEKL